MMRLPFSPFGGFGSRFGLPFGGFPKPFVPPQLGNSWQSGAQPFEGSLGGLPGQFPAKIPGTFNPMPFEGGLGGLGRLRKRSAGFGMGGFGWGTGGFPQRELY